MPAHIHVQEPRSDAESVTEPPDGEMHETTPHQAGEPLGSISHADCVIEVCRCRRCWLIVVREENSEEEW
ncbi:hypothetical protein, partial [Fodinicola feengrottensis]|uniref:hypothetical protein n=1 Tax=Fodinicola feengrottensis TaxID=435914 RepID=UPI0031D0C17B